MGLPELFRRTKSGVVQILYLGTDPPGSGTGFFAHNKLITNYHVIAPALAKGAAGRVAIRFYNDKPNWSDFMFDAPLFASRVQGMSEENSYDYAIVDLPELLKRAPYQFDFSAASGPPEDGKLVAFQGFPFGEQRLVSHAGFVSSVYSSGVVTMIQLDANVNSGNSGGPLIDVESGKVVGVVSRKETGLSKLFDELIDAFRNNLSMVEELQKRGGGASINIMGIDPVEAFKVTQTQLGRVSQEIKRSANVGIGFAVFADALREEAAIKG